jgi:hypothetical protein
VKFARFGADPQTPQLFEGSTRPAGGIERLCITRHAWFRDSAPRRERAAV